MSRRFKRTGPVPDSRSRAFADLVQQGTQMREQLRNFLHIGDHSGPELHLGSPRFPPFGGEAWSPPVLTILQSQSGKSTGGILEQKWQSPGKFAVCHNHLSPGV